MSKKNVLSREEKLEGVPEVFLSAMLAGYFAEIKNKAARANIRVESGVTDWSGRVIAQIGPDYGLLDGWTIDRTTYQLRGGTEVFFRKVLIWKMTYEGWYSNAVLPFLREVLRTAYRGSDFIGGRGPGRYVSEKFAYENDWEGDLISFRGHESVRTNKGLLEVGYQDYRGGAVP